MKKNKLRATKKEIEQAKATGCHMTRKEFDNGNFMNKPVKPSKKKG